jgi:hypothetical protein
LSESIPGRKSIEDARECRKPVQNAFDGERTAALLKALRHNATELVHPQYRSIIRDDRAKFQRFSEKLPEWRKQSPSAAPKRPLAP